MAYSNVPFETAREGEQTAASAAGDGDEPLHGDDGRLHGNLLQEPRNPWTTLQPSLVTPLPPRQSVDPHWS